MTRILHLRSSRTIAGPERQIHELALAMRGSGFELEVALLSRRSVADPSPHPFLAELRASGIPAVEIADPERSGRSARRALRSRLASGAFRIVHSHDPKANWVARAASADGVARVATIHLHTRTTPALRLHAWIDRWNLRRFDRLIAVAESVPGSLTGRGGIQPRVIVNGIDAARVATEAAAEREAAGSAAGRGRAEDRLLLVGRLSPQKGVDLLIRALPAILAARPGTRLEIAGDGPERAALVELAERTGVAPAIAWLGSRRDVLSLVSGATMLMHPSRFEGAVCDPRSDGSRDSDRGDGGRCGSRAARRRRRGPARTSRIGLRARRGDDRAARPAGQAGTRREGARQGRERVPGAPDGRGDRGALPGAPSVSRCDSPSRWSIPVRSVRSTTTRSAVRSLGRVVTSGS
ncbi:MAG: glycosyltransferase [Thermoanaerobaculia bacterium]